MSAVNDTLGDAEREFIEVLGELEQILSSLTPTQRVFGLCAFCLVLLWIMMHKSAKKQKQNQPQTNSGLFKQFGMALFLVVLFGAGIGVIFVPFAAGIELFT